MSSAREVEGIASGTLHRGAHNQRVARAGEYFVVAELNKRGAYAVSFAGNMPKVDVIACNPDQTRTVYIQVKTKRSGNWHTSIARAKPCEAAADATNETTYWVFVALGELDTGPQYWVVPDWWVQDDIYRAHTAYLDRHGGQRPGNPNSTHHSIDEGRLANWSGKWDQLGVFD
jgi:Holliday junction resolvase-like predicted endonuclease